MDNALEKSISFLLFIVVGILLKKKISAGDETNGLKSLILTLALPATIFIALLKIKINSSFLVYPILALALNVVLFSITPLLLSLVGIKPNSQEGKSARLLLPSLAPGLSCFPFILEFLGEDALAKAAMADLGNKFFVLILLYLVALRWHYNSKDYTSDSLKTKLISLGKTLLYEPVNLFIFLALILVSFGITLNKLPDFLSVTLLRISSVMTPLVLLFIGLAVKLKKKQFFELSSLLILRASLSLLLVCGIVALADIKVKTTILLMIAFSLSSCSFWPFAHISSINFKENKEEKSNKTFNTNFSLSILALSLPVSVLLILAILSTNDTFTSVSNILYLSIVLFSIGILYPIFKKIKISFHKKELALSQNEKANFKTDK